MASKVLLVEDDNNLREIYEARLQAEGYTIVSAKDGEEALVVAKAEKPDLIVSDVMMPKISGFEMLDILRNTDGLKDTKVIMLTALGQADDKTRADSLGADRYLVKSQVTLEDIVKAAHELLEDTSGAAPAPASTDTAPAASTTPPATPAAPVPPVSTPTIAVAEAPSAEPAPASEPASSTTPTPPAATPTTTTGTTPAAATPTTAAMVTPIESPKPADSSSAPTAATPAQPTAEPVAPATPLASEPSTSQAPDAAAPEASAKPDTAPTATETAPKPAPGDLDTETTAEEQATMEEQINDFIKQTNGDDKPAEATPAVTTTANAKPSAEPTTPAVTEPTPAATPPVTEQSETTPPAAGNAASSDDALMAGALKDLSTDAASETTPKLSSDVAAVEVKQPPADDTGVQPAPEHAAPEAISGDNVTIAHKKVIQPPSSSNKPDLNELLAAEEAKNIMNSTTTGATPAAASQPQPSAPAAPANTGPAPVKTYLTDAPQSQPKTEADKPQGSDDFDPNDIAL